MGCGFSRIFNGIFRSRPRGNKLFGNSKFGIRTKDGDEVTLDGQPADIIEESEIPEGYFKKTVEYSLEKYQVDNMSKRNSASKREPSDVVVVRTTSLEEAAELAVRNRNKEQLLHVINKCGEWNAFLPASSLPKKKTSAVELACILGYFDMVEVFLDNGCSPNLPTSAGKLLHSVLDSLKANEDSLNAGQRVIKILCKKGCDLNIKDYKGNTPLMQCAQIGDTVIMKEVLSRCSEQQLSHRSSGSLNTPLHMSVMRGDFECVRLLLEYSPHKHVNIPDKYGNTALHLALKSMLHNIPYLNAAKEHIAASSEVGRENQSFIPAASKSNSSQKHVFEQLTWFQHNAIAIVEALVMAGADLHATCCPPSANDFQYYPLIYALRLCAEDETEGFIFEQEKFSSMLHLVSQQTIQSLQRWKVSSTCMEENIITKFSVYAGVVRLLVLAGTEVSNRMRAELFQRFSSETSLINELCVFWDSCRIEKPPKLIHLAKQKIRLHLASVQKLHLISQIPLPPCLQDYVKINYL